MRVLLCLALLSSQDRRAELLKAGTVDPAATRPAWSRDGTEGRRMTWLDGVIEYGRSRGVDVIADPHAIERLLL